MKTAIVYESTTGNTEQMAKAIRSGVLAAGGDVTVYHAGAASADEVLACDTIFFGSSAMDGETLEDSMEVFFSSIEKSLSGKKIGLFGSYDWGDGQWMRTWENRVRVAGGELLNGAGVTGRLLPDTDVLAACTALGKTGID
ncbi:MAG: flavodoxin domain-containing protein [Treponema sp.]|jgi:flavodoxin short chain|nr:flavodoxin domain-containing protein [Treponema sp.]